MSSPPLLPSVSLHGTHRKFLFIIWHPADHIHCNSSFQISHPPSIIVKSCHSPNCFYYLFLRHSMFYGYIFMDIQNWRLHPGRRQGVFPVAGVFFTLPVAMAVFSGSSYSKVIFQNVIFCLGPSSCLPSLRVFCTRYREKPGST